MNILLSVAVIIILPAGGLFSSPILCVFFFYLFFFKSAAVLSSLQLDSWLDLVALLVRVAGQSLGIATVWTALCLPKVQPKAIGKRQPHVSVTPLPLYWQWRCSCGWWFLALEVPTPGVKAAAALPQVSQVHVSDHLRAHLSHASLLQEIRQHFTTSLVSPFITRLSQCVSRITLRLCQPHSGPRVK